MKSPRLKPQEVKLLQVKSNYASFRGQPGVENAFSIRLPPCGGVRKRKSVQRCSSTKCILCSSLREFALVFVTFRVAVCVFSILILFQFLPSAQKGGVSGTPLIL